jgi:glycosyltransferase involved in cell wall biosynthesis
LHLVSLKTEVEGLLVPSKFYSALAAGRPVLYVGDPKSEIAKTIDDAGCGRAFRVEAHVELAATIRDLASRPAEVAEMGARARALWATHFQRKQALARWEAVVIRAIASKT